MNNTPNFSSEFLENYLKFGLGSMPKSDIDALVMALIERYGFGDNAPLVRLSNQAVSELLRTPVSKVKKIRYDAALKFGGKVEDQAKDRLLAALVVATLEPEGEKVCLVIEDTLAKNWLQGRLKERQQIFDHSFNTEIIKVSAAGLFAVLEGLFGKKEIKVFQAGYEAAKKNIDAAQRVELFKKLAQKFVEGTAKAAGVGVYSVVKAHLGIL